MCVKNALLTVDFVGGRTRIRTLDPLIKSKRYKSALSRHNSPTAPIFLDLQNGITDFAARNHLADLSAESAMKSRKTPGGTSRASMPKLTNKLLAGLKLEPGRKDRLLFDTAPQLAP